MRNTSKCRHVGSFVLYRDPKVQKNDILLSCYANDHLVQKSYYVIHTNYCIVCEQDPNFVQKKKAYILDFRGSVAEQL